MKQPLNFYRKARKDGVLLLLTIAVAVTLAGCRSMTQSPVMGPAVESQANGSGIVARINGQPLTYDALVRQYDLYTTLYGDSGQKQQVASLGSFLGKYILQMLLLQEAETSDIRVRPDEIEAERAAYLQATGLSEEMFYEKLTQAGLGVADADRLFENNRIVERLSRTKFADLSASIEDAQAFYNENPDYFFVQDPDSQETLMIPFDFVKDAIRENLTTSRMQSALFSYALQLRVSADIELYDIDAGPELTSGPTPVPEAELQVPVSPFPTFEETGYGLCTDEEGRPLILLFSASWCSHCQWVGDLFDLIASEYVDRGLVAAHHYDLDTGDDLLTEAVETRIPDAHRLIGERGNPEGYLPYFNFGGRYHRIGTGYEAQNDLAAEAEEMCRVIEALLP